MIEKKPPRPTGSFDDDDLAAGIDGHEDIIDDDSNSGEADADAMVARQKRNGMIMTYGVGAAFLAVVGFMGYPKFKHYFVSSTPVAVAYVGTATPPNARKNYFADSAPGHDETTADTSTTPNTIPGLRGTAASKLLSGNGPEGSPTLPPPPTPAMTPVVAVSDQGAPVPAAGTPAVQSPAAAGGTPVTTAATPVVPAPPPTTSPAANTMIPALDAAPVAESDDVKSIKTEVDKLKAADDARADQLQKLQSTVEGLQKQIADLATVKPAPVVVPDHTHTAPVAPAPMAAGAKWQLRSAIDGVAYLGKPNSPELKRVAVGDLVSGLGKITSIKEQDGQWVVQGTDGSISH